MLLLARGARAQQIAEQGLRIRGLVDFDQPVPVLADPAAFQGAQFLVVTTKSDKLSGNHLRSALHKLAEEFGSQRILPFSARTGAGRDELWKAIRGAAHPESPTES